MEEAGAQVAPPPIFINHHQQTLASSDQFRESRPMANNKRTLPPSQPTFFHTQQTNPPRDHWNPMVWDWDSVSFVAKPLEPPDIPCVNTVPSVGRIRQDENNAAHSTAPMTNKPYTTNVGGDEDDERLHLKLGRGGSLISVEETGSRPNKKVRSRSPGGANYLVCQVDNCKEDLSNAKDYHRRHKVCEVHSKASKARVGKQMQRFCQQCSRFHPLSEFDEGKRSCRRRLAGHNRRRRKTKPEDVTSRLLLPGNHENIGNGNVDINNLLTVLARPQGKRVGLLDSNFFQHSLGMNLLGLPGNTGDRSTDGSVIPKKDSLIQMISKINTIPLPADFAAKLPISGSSNTRVPLQLSSENQNRSYADASSQSTMELLTVISATLAAPTSDTRGILSQRSIQGSDSEKTKSACTDQSTCLNLRHGPAFEFPPAWGERSSTSCQSPVDDSDCQIQETRSNLPLQLFSSSPDDYSPTKLVSGRKYFSSDSSNPMEERPPSSSPSVVQKLIPMQTFRDIVKPECMPMSGAFNKNGKVSRTGGCITALDFFGGSSRPAMNGSFQNLSIYQAGYTSSSGSDHSPSSFSSDAQDRTGRIIFKLFDKDPSHLPGTLRTQIYNWLSQCPSEMESYIRPGCVVLSVYMSMSSYFWEQLEENFFQCVNSLVQEHDSDFWESGRFLVHTNRQLASYKDGKIRLCKTWSAWNSPDLISVSPLAVVSGKETSFLLRGRNLSSPGTRIHCAHMGGCTSKEIPGSAFQGTRSDKIRLVCFTISDPAPAVLGRCFIEVENCLRGTSFPVIIADAPICKELSLLESEIEDGKMQHDSAVDYAHDFGRPRPREEVLHFLNELGWLFQRKGICSMPEGPDYTLSRLKFLLVFSVERSFCALIKTLLDILVERNFGRDGLSRELLEMLSEIHLLNRAVKRRCRNMVEMLMQYSLLSPNDTSKKYIFQPNLVGPGGVTPLHLAACSSNSDDMVDALTSDPQRIGLHCWNSLLDVNGLSPYAYALMRNNHSYNRLVCQKLADRKNGPVSISIENEIVQQLLSVDQDQRPTFSYKLGQNYCSKCTIVAARYNRRIPGSQGILHSPNIHSMLAIAAVCVCVCLFLRGAPDIDLVYPFKWENLGYGTI